LLSCARAEIELVFADVVVHGWRHVAADAVEQVLLRGVQRARVCPQLAVERCALARLMSAHGHLVEAERTRESRLRLVAVRLAQSPHALAEASIAADLRPAQRCDRHAFLILFRPHRYKHKGTSSFWRHPKSPLPGCKARGRTDQGWQHRP
jgi:hypothetical protein